MTHNFVDSAKIGSVKKTQDGFLTARARAVRSGIQLYRASELGDMAIAAGFNSNDTVRVMRPEDEVFAADSVATFNHAPVTINHPTEMVDADNWKALAVGEVGNKVMRDGEFLALDLILKDAAAIAAVKSGKKELSAGYTAEIEFVDGVKEYDAVMKNIRVNHLALVDKGRAGSEARIGDDADNWGAAPLTAKTEVKMTEFTKVVFGDMSLQVLATDADALTTLIAAKDKQIGDLTAQLADAQSKILSDEDMEAMVEAKAEKKRKRKAVEEKMGDAAKDLTDAQIEGAFLVLDKAAPPADDTARKALADRKMADADPWAAVNAKLKGRK